MAKPDQGKQGRSLVTLPSKMRATMHRYQKLEPYNNSGLPRSQKESTPNRQ
ncbi:uncharacterized protein PgNI_09636, partial [Pyricularia grisea]|uniref:Uncharacterized protein n=1 Tax=Pyricularia grisea TaxID=148305 RepID=A0A6P8ASH0_PYRGI